VRRLEVLDTEQNNNKTKQYLVLVHPPLSRWLVADLKVSAGQFTHVDKEVEPPFEYLFPAAHEGCSVQERTFFSEEYLPTRKNQVHEVLLPQNVCGFSCTPICPLRN
jgi:hypothetical protein